MIQLPVTQRTNSEIKDRILERLRLISQDMTHVMLSYNWKHQKLVQKIYEHLSKAGIDCWMDIQGGMKVKMMESMSEGVEKASVVIVFCSKEYQTSENCQIELKYAHDLEIPILPVICDKNYTRQRKGSGIKNPAEWPSSWLGALIAGKIYVDFRDEMPEGFKKSLTDLIGKINLSKQTKRSNKGPIPAVVSDPFRNRSHSTEAAESKLFSAARIGSTFELELLISRNTIKILESVDSEDYSPCMCPHNTEN